MYKYLLLLAAFVVPSITNATTVFTVKKEMVCNSAKIVMELVAEYKETPMWIGTMSKSSFVVTVNQATGDWTLLEISGDVACIVGEGTASSFNINKLVNKSNNKNL